MITRLVGLRRFRWKPEYHFTSCADGANQPSRAGYLLTPAIETRHSEIILAVLPLASGQNFPFCRGVPQLDCAIPTPGRQPLPVGREGHRRDRVRMPFEGEQLLAGA